MLFGVVLAYPAYAVLDVNDAGPTVRAGRVAMRVTNAGILGNAFYDVGLSSDPSLEYPINSGQELMNHAELWVGALDDLGNGRVSGGPALEWRPTPDPSDHVLEAWRGRLGSRRAVDDDGDGRIDEETLNGRDDDGDGEIDEDLGFTSQQLMAADYADDRPGGDLLRLSRRRAASPRSGSACTRRCTRGACPGTTTSSASSSRSRTRDRRCCRTSTSVSTPISTHATATIAPASSTIASSSSAFSVRSSRESP